MIEKILVFFLAIVVEVMKQGGITRDQFDEVVDELWYGDKGNRKGFDGRS